MHGRSNIDAPEQHVLRAADGLLADQNWRAYRRFRYAGRIRGSWLRTATVQLIGEDARPAPWDLPLKLGRMGFSGWSPKAVEFFQDLQTDNTKAYWSAHRGFYEASVREPMAELLDELSGEFGPGRIGRASCRERV